MRFLLDSNVLLRWGDSKSPEHAVCAKAVSTLAQRSNVIFLCAQVLIESYVVATRPPKVNGLGYSLPEGHQLLAEIEGAFPCLPEPADMAARWRKVAIEHGVMGRQGHDARIVAIMLAHGISHLITLNTADFARYTDVAAVTPSEAVSLSPPPG